MTLMLPPAQQALLEWYENLTQNSLAELPRFYNAEAFFKDPFNEVNGHAAITRIFHDMFDKTLSPRFIILDRLFQGNQLFVTWDFKFGIGHRSYSIHGGSHLHFDDAGKIIRHRDYWDPAEELWQHMPILGKPIAWLRRQFRAR